MALLCAAITLLPAAARADDLAWSRSAAVARAAVRELRSRPSAGSMLSQYTAAFVSGQGLQMTVSAPLASQAVRRANVLGAGFLRTGATLLGAEAQLEVQAAGRQIARLSRRAAALAPLVASAAKAATSPARLRALRRLRARYYRATSAAAPRRRAARAGRGGGTGARPPCGRGCGR